jgi:4-amino-4-deoxy-L-arabinose transferase-like glycosyltransferase
MLRALAAGAATGAGILVRPALLFFVPLAVLWLVRRRQAALAAAAVAATIAVLAPWTIRNAVVHGRFVLVASEGGVTFWTGNHPLAIGEGDLAANPQLKHAELAFRRAHPGLTAEQLEPLYYRDALAWIAASPGRWAGLIARKLFYTVVPIGPSYTLHSTRYRVASVASYLLVLLLAIAGFPRLWRSERRPTAVLLLGASAVLVGLVFFPQERFRIPVLDPVLVIAAAANAAARVPSGQRRPA